MPDPLSELRQALEGLIERIIDTTDSGAGRVFAGGIVAPGLAGVADGDEIALFATGYDGTSTTVPFTLDVSALGPEGTDILTG